MIVKGGMSISNEAILKKTISVRIGSVHRIIPTICEHIADNKSLTGTGEGICADETAYCGIVISALQVVEAGFFRKEVTEAPNLSPFC